MLRQKIDYIHLNPVRMGVVARAEDWVYSSAGDYSDCQKFFPVTCLIVGARRAVPSGGWAWLAMPLQRNYFWQSLYAGEKGIMELDAFD